MDLLRKAAELADSHVPFAMATIVEASGSTPRSSAKMLVLADGTSYGTVGGGAVEALVVKEAREAIARGASRLLDYSLAPGGGQAMACGGAMKVFVEVFAARARLVVVGAGHVGQATASLAARLGYRVAVVDHRPEYATAERLPMAGELYVRADLAEALALAPVGSDDCVVVCTSSHHSDALAVRTLARALSPGGCRYLGVLGSRRKVAGLVAALREDGLPYEDIAGLRAPIGLDLGAETPEEIALSIVAEIAAALSGGSGLPLSRRPAGPVVVRGAGDLATGVIVRLRAAGLPVVALELGKPTCIRRTVALSEAVYDGSATVEGVEARLASAPEEALELACAGLVPVLVDPELRLLPALGARALVDATLAKRNLGLSRELAPVVVAVGPGFEAGTDAHAVVETQRGHDLGRVIRDGAAAPDSGVPGEIGGRSAERVLRAPVAGEIVEILSIGQGVAEGGAVIGVRGDSGLVEVKSAFAGVVRGALRPGLTVPRGMKIADVDPRGVPEHCLTVSDKARAVGGGVLEALLAFGCPLSRGSNARE